MRQLVTKSDFNVPGSDSAANTSMWDVIGNKNDTHDSDSIMGQLDKIEEHIHTPSNVSPTLADGIWVSGGAAWTLGAFSDDIVASGGIASKFDVHHVSVEAMSANDVYELVLYRGPTDVECGRVRFTKNANLDATMNVPMLTPILPAHSRIKAKVASATGTDAVQVSIFYHVYP